MRVVHAITRFIRGGADENTLYTVNGQVALGHEVWLIIGDHHPAMVEALDPRVHLVIEPTLVRRVAPVTDLKCLVRMTRLFRELGPDLVHTHESKAGILGRLAARIASVPCIVHGVHILPFVGVSKLNAAIYLALEKIAARVTDAYIDVSPGMRDLCLRHGLGSPHTHFMVPSGMDTEKYRSAKPLEEFQAAGVAVGVMAGTLEPRKRIAEFIHALAAQPAAAAWKLVIAGVGPARPDIEAAIARHGLADKVVLLGHRGDLERVIASADICLHAASNEGLPRVVVQYVLARKPVLATALAGIERVVATGVSGRIVDSGDLPGLAREFVALAADAGLRARLSEGTQAIDLARWDTGAMVAEIEAVYASLGGTATANQNGTR